MMMMMQVVSLCSPIVTNLIYEHEQMKLNHSINMDDRLEVGAMALSIHLEYRMREHMNTQFPKAIAKLKASLVDTNERLESIREREREIFC